MGNVNSNVFYIDGGHPAPQSRKPYQYKYNYREWQDELDLNVTAMDFRQYDNALGRFHNMDRLAELAPGITPYRFAFNNPNYWSDPTGLFESWAAAISYALTNNISGDILFSGGENGFYYISTGSGLDAQNIAMFGGELSIVGTIIEEVSVIKGGGGGGSSGGSGTGGSGGGFSGGFGFGGNGGFDGVGGYGGGGYGGSTPTSNIDWDRINTGITAFGIGNGVKTGLIEYTGKAGELSNFTKNYLKFFKGAGIAGSIVTTGYSGYNVYQQYEQGGNK